jgi:hypothetical protein
MRADAVNRTQDSIEVVGEMYRFVLRVLGWRSELRRVLCRIHKRVIVFQQGLNQLELSDESSKQLAALLTRAQMSRFSTVDMDCLAAQIY